MPWSEALRVAIPGGEPGSRRSPGRDPGRCVVAAMLESRESMQATINEAERTRTIRHLKQLIEALNRRVPHIERAGEAKIARDAAELMKQAVRRLRALEKSE